MANKKDMINNRNRLFSIIDKYMDTTNLSIEIYFRQRKDLKAQLKIIDKKPQAKLNDEHSKLLEQIDFEEVYNSIVNMTKDSKSKRKDDRKKRFKTSYEDVKKAIKSNSTVSLNALCSGMFGPLDSPNRTAQAYNAYNNLYFKVDKIKPIDKEFEEALKDYKEPYITPNTLAMLLSNEIISIDPNEDIDDETGEDNEISTKTGTRNIIYFGPPGTGKSYKMEGKAEEIQVDLNDIIRVTFHPEYSYYDFIGQYKPVVGHEFIKNKVTDFTGKEILPLTNYSNNEFKRPFVYYDFVPGPFTKAIIRALEIEENNKNALLVIEEINRGNCSAIFGDVFQLLDRINDVYNDNYGRSQYQIDITEEMKNYIMNQLNWSKDKWDSYFPKGFTLPSNLFIFATMNTSDQSLFPMDSAFKRRWSMEYVSIDYETEELQDINLPTPYEDIKWLDFIKVINQKIVEYTETDDKQIGQWFLGKELDKDEFLGKVLSYLWFDVFRQHPVIIFKDNIKTFDDLKNYYDKGVIRIEIIDEMVDENV